MYEVYRVRKPFMWNGYQYTPDKPCKCNCSTINEKTRQMIQCTSVYASECQPCRDIYCKCQCTITTELHAGSIWIVEAGHPRKEIMLDKRMGYFAMGDASLPSSEELLKSDKYSRLLTPVQINSDILSIADKAKRKHKVAV